MRVARRSRSGWAWVLVGISFGALGAARAQTPSAPPPPVAVKGGVDAPTEANDLQTALAATAWDANTRGPLLTLDPASVAPWTPQDGDNVSAYSEDDTPPIAAKPLALPGGRERLRLETTAAHFGRKLVRIGSLAALAPTEMVVLNENLPPRDPFARLGRDEKFRMLAASFDAAQWKALASASGLGLSQLDKDQQALFLSYLPSPLKLRRGVTSSGRNGITYPDGKKNAVIATEEQRRGIRLRLNLAAQITLVKAKSARDDGGYDYTRYPVQTKPVGKPEYSILARDNDDEGARDAFGVTLSAKVPSRLKPSQIAFDAPVLAAPVSLAGAQTLGDLIRRIGDATGLEIYADPRIARLTVWARLPDGATPSTVRAGDLLQGLCWCVTGAVRRVEAVRMDSAALAFAAAPPRAIEKGEAVTTAGPVRSGPGPAFVLTDALSGVGVRNARLYEWYNEGSGAVYVLRTRLKLKIQAQNPLQYLGWDKNDKGALPEAVMDRLKAGWETERGRYGGTTVRTAQLPREQQALVQQAALYYLAQPQQEGAAKNAAPTFKNDQVSVRLNGRTTLTIPGVGEAEDNSAMGTGLINIVLPPADRWSDDDDEKPASSAPVVLAPAVASGSALFVAPRDAEGAIKAVQAARKQGLSQVWLSVEGDTAQELNLAPIRAGIAEGEKTGVAVYAVARVLSLGGRASGGEEDTPKATETTAATPVLAAMPPAESVPADMNLFGETIRVYIARKLAETEAAQSDGAQTLRAELLDYRRPDLPETATVVREKMLAISETPGLAGLVLHETAAPGEGVPKAPGYGADGAEGGYTPEMRLAFLRRTGCDPIDFSSDVWMGGLNLALPFFGALPTGPDGTGGVPQQWGALRFEQNARLMTRLYSELRAAKPHLPLLMQERANNQWWGTWDKADVLPAGRDQRDNETTNEAQRAQETAHHRLLAAYFLPEERPLLASWIKPDPWPADSPQAFAKSVNERIKSLPGKWDGVVFDLSDLPVGKALELFAAGVARPGVPPSPSTR